MTVERPKTLGRGRLRANAAGRQTKAEKTWRISSAQNIGHITLPPRWKSDRSAARAIAFSMPSAKRYGLPTIRSREIHIQRIVEASDDSQGRGIRGFIVEIARRLDGEARYGRAAIIDATGATARWANMERSPSEGSTRAPRDSRARSPYVLASY